MKSTELNLDALLDGSIKMRGQARPCVIERTLISLEEPYQSALASMLADVSIPANVVVRRLAAAGLPGGWTAVTRHRESTCTCKREAQL